MFRRCLSRCRSGRHNTVGDEYITEQSHVGDDGTTIGIRSRGRSRGVIIGPGNIKIGPTQGRGGAEPIGNSVYYRHSIGITAANSKIHIRVVAKKLIQIRKDSIRIKCAGRRDTSSGCGGGDHNVGPESVRPNYICVSQTGHGIIHHHPAKSGRRAGHSHTRAGIHISHQIRVCGEQECPRRQGSRRRRSRRQVPVERIGAGAPLNLLLTEI